MMKRPLLSWDYSCANRRRTTTCLAGCWRIGCFFLLLQVSGHDGGAVSSEWDPNLHYRASIHHPQHQQHDQQQQPTAVSLSQDLASPLVPHYNQNHHQHQHQQNQHHNPPQVNPPDATPPNIQSEHLVKALKRTAFINDRLARNNAASASRIETLDRFPLHSQSIPYVASSRTRTMFHSSSSSNNPSLLSTMVAALLQQVPSPQERSTVLSLAMIYLDRATSVETPRTSSGISRMPPCPFCTTETVHRLVLCAILTALRVVQGQTLTPTAEWRLPSLLEPSLWAALDLDDNDLEHLREMMAWMEAALGDVRYYVSLEDMIRFKRGWERAFPVSQTTTTTRVPTRTVPTTDPSQPHHQQLQQQQQQQQQPESQALTRDD